MMNHSALLRCVAFSFDVFIISVRPIAGAKSCWYIKRSAPEVSTACVLQMLLIKSTVIVGSLSPAAETRRLPLAGI